MTKEPYVVNNLLLFTVLSYDLTVDIEDMKKKKKKKKGLIICLNNK